MNEIIVIAGASGAGKTTVANEIFAISDKFELSRSATTRPRRNDGNDGEYLYLDRREFEDRISRLEMLEYTEYSGNLYGTPLSEPQRIISSGKTPILILDINGVKTLRKLSIPYNPIVFYIYEDLSVIERRLRAREQICPTGNSGAFLRRIEANRQDFLDLENIYALFDAFVKNTDARSAAIELLELFDKIKGGYIQKDNAEIARRLSGSVKRKLS